MYVPPCLADTDFMITNPFECRINAFVGLFHVTIVVDGLAAVILQLNVTLLHFFTRLSLDTAKIGFTKREESFKLRE